MGESMDVKALRARFNTNASTSDTGSSRDSSSPNSPLPGFGRSVSPSVPPPLTGPGLIRFPRAEPMASSLNSRHPSFPQPPPSSGVRPSHLADANKAKQTGEMLQNMMLRGQRPQAAKPAVNPALAPALAPARSPVLAPTVTHQPLQQQQRQRSAVGVTPLRRPLPPEGPLPLKPRRPPSVNLEPYRNINRGRGLSPSKQSNLNSSSSLERKTLPPPVAPLPKPQPQRYNKPSSLPHQIASVDIDDDDQGNYDDIGSFERNESWSDKESHCMDGDDEDDVYECVDEGEVKVNQVDVAKMSKKEAKKQQEKEKREKLEQQKKEKELWKNFSLQGEIEVLHTARVRHDWYGGGKLDLDVRQGESVEILRVKNNPGGKWLARSLTGNYGYISNTCVDIDYEAVKRNLLLSRRKMDTSPLPPPPPDPPMMLHMDSYNDCEIEDEGDYDDVQPSPDDFPPPPPPHDVRMEKDLRKKFKYDGPLRVLHTMMVNPHGVVKKPGGKDLPVSQGEVLDVIQLTNSKKALCRNMFGKYGYVSRSLLLPLEGDVYDDVDYPSVVYDNDSSHIDY